MKYDTKWIVILCSRRDHGSGSSPARTWGSGNGTGPLRNLGLVSNEIILRSSGVLVARAGIVNIGVCEIITFQL